MATLQRPLAPDDHIVGEPPPKTEHVDANRPTSHLHYRDLTALMADRIVVLEQEGRHDLDSLKDYMQRVHTRWEEAHTAKNALLVQFRRQRLLNAQTGRV